MHQSNFISPFKLQSDILDMSDLPSHELVQNLN